MHQTPTLWTAGDLALFLSSYPKDSIVFVNAHKRQFDTEFGETSFEEEEPVCNVSFRQSDLGACNGGLVVSPDSRVCETIAKQHPIVVLDYHCASSHDADAWQRALPRSESHFSSL